MVKDLGRFHILIDSYEQKIREKTDFLAKFRHKTVSRIL